MKQFVFFVAAVAASLTAVADVAHAGGVVITNGKGDNQTTASGESAPKGEVRTTSSDSPDLNDAMLLDGVAPAIDAPRGGNADGANTMGTIVGGIAYDAEPEFICDGGDETCDDGYGGCNTLPTSGVAGLFGLALLVSRRKRR